MNLFKKLGNFLAGPPAKTERVLYLFVECDRCREKLRARVDVWNELTPEYDGKSDDPVAYQCRKVLVGEKMCFQPIELNLKFDRNHRLVDKKISGGYFIEEADFENKR